ncbi:MAG TPA: RimK family alpha-L-glutamate ligase [Burkholderiales bacterium]|nr:RimK family alpha-L-glutamate ligase [Burkholderiales bacterium]
MSAETTSSPIGNEPVKVPFIGLPALMRMAMKGLDLTPLGLRLIEYVKSNPAAAESFLDIATIFQLKQNKEFALRMQTEALKMQQIYRQPATISPIALRLLAIMGPGDLMANTPLEFLVEDSDVELDMLYVGPGIPFPAELPDYDVVFVAIGESDHNRPLLEHVDKMIADWRKPVLNRPDKISQLARDDACAMLESVPGIVMPKTRRADRARLQEVAQGGLPITAIIDDGDFPVIVRPIDSHAGQGLMKLDAPSDLDAYLAQRDEAAFYVSRFVEYKQADGLYRKYRIVLIRGRPYVCHLALSRHWMVHYLNAEMLDNPENREEEARFMANFDDTFAIKHQAAFNEISARAGLDYLGIDCGETADGKLLIFEIDSNMIVHALDPVEIFPYKHPQMRKVFAAFREMLLRALTSPYAGQR